MRSKILGTAIALLAIFSVATARTPQASAPSGAESIETQHFEPTPIRITLDELPEPFASESVSNNPTVVEASETPTLKAPKGFRVSLFADGVPKARWLALTPAGDVLCSCGRTNKIHLLRDTNDDGVADQRHLFLDKAAGANLPFGMDFAQIDGQWYFYLGNTDAVVRFPYSRGAVEISTDPEKVTDLPGRGYNQHWTRNVRVAPDGEHLFATVGSESNVDVEPLPRASVLRMQLDGSEREVFASGLRNPVGLDFEPNTANVYTNVNERDKLGDQLVPDYFTRIEKGQFFGWPYAYLQPEWLDPRRMDNGQSEQPELAAQTHTPDVLFESHSAALGLAFGGEAKFPERYRNGAFACFRGSWNRSQGTGYKLVFIPFGEDHRPLGYYEDFVTGFLLDPSVPKTWGRPVGVIIAADGSLLFTEESNGRIYRVSYESTE